MTSILDVDDVQQALDALITGDDQVAADRSTRDVVLTALAAVSVDASPA